MKDSFWWFSLLDTGRSFWIKGFEVVRASWLIYLFMCITQSNALNTNRTAFLFPMSETSMWTWPHLYSLVPPEPQLYSSHIRSEIVFLLFLCGIGYVEPALLICCSSNLITLRSAGNIRHSCLHLSLGRRCRGPWSGSPLFEKGNCSLFLRLLVSKCWVVLFFHPNKCTQDLDQCGCSDANRSHPDGFWALHCNSYIVFTVTFSWLSSSEL